MRQHKPQESDPASKHDQTSAPPYEDRRASASAGSPSAAWHWIWRVVRKMVGFEVISRLGDWFAEETVGESVFNSYMLI